MPFRADGVKEGHWGFLADRRPTIPDPVCPDPSISDDHIASSDFACLSGGFPALIRSSVATLDVVLAPLVFAQLCDLWGVSMVISPYSPGYLVPLFVSWFLTLGALGSDAMSGP
ncbi:hypothetical protein NDU88_001932 [Pleurodeles waltl]|uniref:Uncharacterized protein n=1 Tax=Pleurodeles waltl TaxID=8319 RepID=A0AAV7LCT6_PLEWA|nr:hypothetical protein NDU88_001932 [Pleurodeles waltl]